jgi:mpaB/rubber oxygenase-like protein
VPSIGRLLDRTGEFTRSAQKRYDDTSLILFEIFHWGAGSERGRQALEQLNAIHGRFRISNDDYVYTLSTFVVTPVRWIERFGWRKLHPREVRALTNTMRRMGEGMNLAEIPETYAEFERLFDDYERENFGFDEGGRRVADATLDLFGSWYPRLLSPAVARAARFLMDPHLLTAFGFPQVQAAGRRAAELGLKARAQLLRVGPVRPDSRPVTPEPLSYPNGYEIGELGPESFHRHRVRNAKACPVATWHPVL